MTASDRTVFMLARGVHVHRLLGVPLLRVGLGKQTLTRVTAADPRKPRESPARAERVPCARVRPPLHAGRRLSARAPQPRPAAPSERRFNLSARRFERWTAGPGIPSSAPGFRKKGRARRPALNQCSIKLPSSWSARRPSGDSSQLGRRLVTEMNLHGRLQPVQHARQPA